MRGGRWLSMKPGRGKIVATLIVVSSVVLTVVLTVVRIVDPSGVRIEASGATRIGIRIEASGATRIGILIVAPIATSGVTEE